LGRGETTIKGGLSFKQKRKILPGGEVVAGEEPRCVRKLTEGKTSIGKERGGKGKPKGILFSGPKKTTAKGFVSKKRALRGFPLTGSQVFVRWGREAKRKTPNTKQGTKKKKNKTK